MSFILRLFISLVAGGIGLVLLVKTRRVVHQVGYINWAEQHLGGGGTYILIKFLGLLVMVIAVFFLLGVIKIF
ncbi:MAG: hypothetical protein Q7S53_02140 [bacterium]|nr:hypothetical protein [bacterium]